MNEVSVRVGGILSCVCMLERAAAERAKEAINKLSESRPKVCVMEQPLIQIKQAYAHTTTSSAYLKQY